MNLTTDVDSNHILQIWLPWGEEVHQICRFTMAKLSVVVSDHFREYTNMLNFNFFDWCGMPEAVFAGDTSIILAADLFSLYNHVNVVAH